MALVVSSSPLNAFHADTLGTPHHTWKSYTNVRFQYSICYPEDLLTPQGESTNSDGQTFLAKGGAKLVAYGRNNALNQSQEDIFHETSARLAGKSGKVTYQMTKPGWFVVSGENGSDIFYAKMLISKDRFKAFEFTYRASEAQRFNPIVGKLASCLVNTD